MVIELIHLLAMVLVGLYAGSLLTEAVILVPYWQSMAPSNFFRLHGTLGPKLFKYYAPLTGLAVGFSILSAFFGNIWQMITAGLCFAALIIFFLYFKKANAAFAKHGLSDEDLGAELSRWGHWHWLRTILIVTALITSGIGLG